MKSLSISLFSLFLTTMTFSQNATVSCPDNMIVKADEKQEGAVVKFPPLSGELAGSVYTPASGSFFRLGSHSVIVTTAAGQKCSFTVTVTDNESPVLSELTLSRDRLWPVNNKMKKVALNYTVSDNGGAVKTTVSVSSNTTDGVKDFEILDDKMLRLKTARLADGSPRVYTISVTAVDNAGNKTTRTTTIAVSETITAIPSI